MAVNLIVGLKMIQIIWGQTTSGCTERSLVGDNRLNLPDSSYSASSYYKKSQQDKRHAPQNAKLNGPFGWASHTNDNPDDYLQLDLGAVRVITAVETQGNGKSDVAEWVTKYKLRFKKEAKSETWTEYRDQFSNCDNKCTPGKVCWSCKYKNRTITAQTVVRHDLKIPQEARYIRFVPVECKGHKTMRVNVFFVNQEAPNVTVTPSERSIFVQWTIQPCSKLAQVNTGYLLDVSKIEEIKVGRDIANKNITGLQPFTEYTIQVKAVPYGLWSDNKTIQTDIAVPQAIPGSVTLEALSSKSIRVNWTHLPNHLFYGPLSGYRITYTKIQGQSRNVDVGEVNTWTITSLEKCTLYSVTVSVKNSKYVGPPSEKATLRTLGNEPLAAPSNVSALPIKASSIAVSWDPVPEDKHSCDVTGYKIKLVSQGCTDIRIDSTKLVLETGRSTVFTGLSLCTYAVMVKAVTNAGSGPFSKAVYVSIARGFYIPPTNVTTSLGCKLAFVIVLGVLFGVSLVFNFMFVAY